MKDITEAITATTVDPLASAETFLRMATQIIEGGDVSLDQCIALAQAAATIGVAEQLRIGNVIEMQRAGHSWTEEINVALHGKAAQS